jgi:hypothetical protein
MKLRVKLERNPNPAFARVAEMIAKGPPPEWLVAGLEHFSGLVSEEPIASDRRKQLIKFFEEMDYAADLLIKRLPFFASVSTVQVPDDIAIALDVLPRIKKLLALLAKPPIRKGGPEPNALRRICAKVVVEAWKLIEKPQPRSVKVWEACNEYWQACGGEYRGETVDTWRRDVEEATERGDLFIRTILSALKASCT